MKILNIDIHFPTKQDFLLFSKIMLFWSIIALGLTLIGFTALENIKYLLLGSFCGTFINVCGVSIAKDGIRAAILVVIFTALVLSIVNYFNLI